MTISEPWTPTPGKGASLDSDLEDAIREYLRTYVMWRGIRQATATFGVSRHTLWRFLRRGHTGRALPRAVLGIVGDSVEVLEAATWAIAAADRVLASRPAAKPVLSPYPLSQALEDTLLLLCAAPLATVDELSRFGRIPASTLRPRHWRTRCSCCAPRPWPPWTSYSPRPVEEAGEDGHGGLGVPQADHFGASPPPAVLPDGEGHTRRGNGRMGSGDLPAGVPCFQAVVPAPGRATRLRGCTLSSRRPSRLRKNSAVYPGPKTVRR